MADIQVFIPVYNDVEHFPKALNSVLSQNHVSVEVIVSDNASTDGTWEYAEKAAKADKRIKLLRNKTNIGMFSNFNKCLDKTSADYFMVLCSDDLLFDDTALTQALEIMKTHDEVASIYCDMAYVDGQDDEITRRIFGRQGIFDAEKALRKSILNTRGMFGIPLLHRTIMCQDLYYAENLNFVADLHLSAKIAQRGAVYHIAKVLIGNRYTGRNATASVHGQMGPQLREVAREFDLKLNPFERLLAICTRFSTYLARRLFFLYVMAKRWKHFNR